MNKSSRYTMRHQILQPGKRTVLCCGTPVINCETVNLTRHISEFLGQKVSKVIKKKGLKDVPVVKLQYQIIMMNGVSRTSHADCLKIPLANYILHLFCHFLHPRVCLSLKTNSVRTNIYLLNHETCAKGKINKQINK